MMAVAIMGSVAIVALVAAGIAWWLLRSPLNPYVQHQEAILAAVEAAKQVPALAAQLAQIHADILAFQSTTVAYVDKQRRELANDLRADLRALHGTLEAMRQDTAAERGAIVTRIGYLEQGLVSVVAARHLRG